MTESNWRELCQELVEQLERYQSDFPAKTDKMAYRAMAADDVLIRARAVLARWGHQPAPAADGEVAELVEWLREEAHYQGSPPEERPSAASRLTRAADLLEQRHPEPVPVAERLPELRGMFERILCVARSSGQRPVGNIQLADRLISAVVSWSALPLPSGEVRP